MSKIRKKKTPNNFARSFNALSPSRKWLLFIFLSIIAFTVLPAVIVLLIGLLPTITVLITDSKNTNKLVVIGGFNLAGVFVYLVSILKHFTMDSALNILSDIFNLIIMLGSAGIGLVLYYEIPNLFIFLSKVSANKRLDNIDKRLQKISEEWGREVIEDQVNKLAK